jgi:hypothetical protein
MKHITMALAIATAGLCGPALADGYGFRTPSGNIYCNGSIEGGDISCTIVEIASGPARPRPASCRGNWGHTFSMDRRGPVRMECNDWALRKSTYTDVANYGVTGRFAEITCQSESTGLTCRNADGHGFMLSRRVQKIF